MGYVCIACGAPWDPAHLCQEMLNTVADGANLARIRGEKRFVFDRGSFAAPAPDKTPSFEELDYHYPRQGWRP